MKGAQVTTTTDGSEGRTQGAVISSRMELLTVKESASMLGIGRSTVYELIYAGRIRSVKIGSSRRIRRGDLDDFVRDLTEVS